MYTVPFRMQPFPFRHESRQSCACCIFLPEHVIFYCISSLTPCPQLAEQDAEKENRRKAKQAAEERSKLKKAKKAKRMIESDDDNSDGKDDDSDVEEGKPFALDHHYQH